MRDITLIGYTVLIVGDANASAATMNGFDLDGALVSTEEILFGGPPKDGIPAIDKPVFVKASQARSLRDDDRVLAITRNGISKAYPFVELAKRSGEAKDVIDGKSILVRYNHTHRSAEAFDAQGKPIAGVTLFWFAWYAFHPQTETYRVQANK